jgi:hypothetical protein
MTRPFVSSLPLFQIGFLAILMKANVFALDQDTRTDLHTIIHPVSKFMYTVK